MSKYGINVVDAGYEDDFWARYEEEKKKLKQKFKADRDKEEDLKSLLLFFLPEITKKRIAILVIWAALYKLFLDYGYGIVYIMFTMIAYMFLSVGKRKPGEKSAYSVFNENCERLPV